MIDYLIFQFVLTKEKNEFDCNKKDKNKFHATKKEYQKFNSE